MAPGTIPRRSIGSPKRALPCFEPPIRDIRLDFISRARVWPGRGNKTTSAKQARIVVTTIAVRDAPIKQACQAVGSDNVRWHRLAATLVGMFCLAKSGRIGMNPYNAASVIDSAMTLFALPQHSRQNRPRTGGLRVDIGDGESLAIVAKNTLRNVRSTP
jgi:hypothetical protein